MQSSSRTLTMKNLIALKTLQSVHRAFKKEIRVAARSVHTTQNSAIQEGDQNEGMNTDRSTDQENISQRTLKFKEKLEKVPSKTFRDFITPVSTIGLRTPSEEITETESAFDVPYLNQHINGESGQNRKVFIETYGCQMNFNDTEIVQAILTSNGFVMTKDSTEADVILLMTCSIRESAESKIWSRVQQYKSVIHKRNHGRLRKLSRIPTKIGVLGCMAERLKTSLIEKEKSIDLVCGPDAYKDLPRLLDVTATGQNAVNVMLSLDETYADVTPVRIDPDHVRAYVSIMRGCDNMCSYCIVPFTRGRERSRPIDSIVDEVRHLSDQGVKEVILLGQNVNSYCDKSESQICGGVERGNVTKNSTGFKTIYKPKVGGRRFAELLDKVSQVNPEMRVRFTAPHPKDFPDEVLQLMKERSNICNSINMPAQSGSTRVLQAMRRGYSREAYLDLVHHIRDFIPNVTLCSDFISGFCGETDEDHQDTVRLLHEVKYNNVYNFMYSMREKTHAHRKLIDDVPDHIKQERCSEIDQTWRKIALTLNEEQIGKHHLVLVEKESKRSGEDWSGKNDGDIKVIFNKENIPIQIGSDTKRHIQPGDYVAVEILSCTSKVLVGCPLYHSSIQDFYSSSIQDQIQMMNSC